MRKLPKLPKLFDATGLEAKLTPLAKRILEWSRAVQDYLEALGRFITTEDFHRADRIGKTELSPRLPTDGQVLTATKAGQAAEWQDAPAGYTDEQAQDAVGGIVGPTSGPYTLIYNDAIPSITLDVDDMVGDSGSGGVKGLVPAPAAGDATAAKFLKADGTWAVPSGGGSTVGIWMPDAPPASPHACDDEFTTASLDSKWTEYDHGNLQTITTSATRALLKLSGTGNGTDRLAGLYQPSPGSEFVIYVKAGAMMFGGGSADPGILLYEDATSPTGKVQVLVATMYRSAPAGAYSASYNAYNSFGSSTNIGYITPVRYLRLRVNGAAFAADVSTDGIEWVQGVSSNMGFSPAHIGLGWDVFDNNGGIVLFDFFRVQSGAGTSVLDATYIGRQVQVGV